MTENKKPVRKATGKAVQKPLERVEPLNDAHLMESHRQCPAMSKRTGERCKRFCAMGMRTCRWHGSATRRSKTAAAVRIHQASGFAAEMLVEFMADPEVDVQLRTKIAQDLLDRSGVNTKTIMELQPKSMSAFELAILGSVVEVDDNGNKIGPAYVDDGQGGMKAVTPGMGFDGGVLVDVGRDEDIVDAEVVYEPDDDTPLVPRHAAFDPETMSRHDRAALSEALRNRDPRPPRGLSREERKRREAEALASAPRSTRSTADPTVARAAYEAALENGATLAEAKEAGRAAAQTATDTTGKRRARTSEATITTGSGRRQRRE